MITKLYVDNFRCLVNFDISLTRNQLWLGDNGTGKSTVLTVLSSLQRVVAGDHVEDMFSANDMTSWLSKTQQTFRINIEHGGVTYEYELTVEPGRKQERCRIRAERLSWNRKTFYEFVDGEAHLYRINRQTGEVEQGAQFGADWGRSLLPTIAERDDNQPLTQFRRYVASWLIVQPVPTSMKAQAEKESRTLASDGRNFADWYRHLVQEHSEVGYKTQDALREVLTGFQTLDLREVGDARMLIAKFRADKKDYDVPFDRLSDGKRQLIFLYVVLNALLTNCPVLFIDEPDNFISTREIQPWLCALRDACTEKGGPEETADCQAIVISHHPETVNVMIDGTERWFHRPQASHTQVGPYPVHEGLTPAETLARGWEND